MSALSENDRVRVRHMLDAAHEVMTFTSGVTRESLASDLKLVRAMSMSIGIIGEAAAHVSPECREANAHIPWHPIIGMRNFLIHAYFNVDLDILWSTAVQAVPALVDQLTDLLGPDSR
jgi:uncharacterized protein with HEPN domain